MKARLPSIIDQLDRVPPPLRAPGADFDPRFEVSLLLSGATAIASLTVLCALLSADLPSFAVGLPPAATAQPGQSGGIASWPVAPAVASQPIVRVR